MKKYRVTIDLDTFEIVVSANNKAEQSEYPALSLYPNWNNQYAHSYGNAIIPETYTIDLTGFRMPTPSTKITSPFGPPAGSITEIHRETTG